MMAGDRVSADPGVAVNASAENATADAVAAPPIVFMTLSGKFEAFEYFEVSPGMVRVPNAPRPLAWTVRSRF
jgi:hypothetical protein